jgi:hypothetical protein
MNWQIVKRLILKDWYLFRLPIAGYSFGGLVALVLVAMATPGTYYVGCILLLTVMIGFGIHLAIGTVVSERMEQTLPFIMTLPVSPREYTMSKIGANLLIFLVPWTTMLVGSIGVIAWSPALPDGMIPFAAIVLVEIFAAYVLLLTVAIASESQGWTIGTMATANFFFQGFLYYVSHIPSIAKPMKGPLAIWSGPAVGIVVTEVAAIVLLLTAAFLIQERKKDFL